MWLPPRISLLFGLMYATQPAYTAVSRPLGLHIRQHEPLHHTFGLASSQHRARRDAGPLEITLPIFGKEFRLILQKDELPSSLQEHTHLSPHYTGTVAGDATSRVHGYFRDGVFDGVVFAADDTYFIEHASKFFPNGSEFPAVAYRGSDVIEPPKSNPVTCTASSGLTPPRYYDSLPPLSQVQGPWHHGHTFGLRRRTVSGGGAVSTGRNTCLMKLVADHTYYRYLGSNTATVTNELITILKSVNYIYGNTTFFEGIPIHIALHSYDPITIVTSPDSYPKEYADVANISLKGTDLLRAFSGGEFNAYCLAMLFLNRDFQDGMLGLAWVGSTAGGICEQRMKDQNGDFKNFNTGFNTNNNFGSIVGKAANIITVAHEIGHGFGADHDPDTQPCTGSPDGNYIMYPKATNGKMPNNNKFSPCSLAAMRTTLSGRATCFGPYPDAVCGNGIREATEECDSAGQSPCCTQNCTLAAGAQCSEDDPCCNAATCKLAGSEQMCREGGPCVYATYCNGVTRECPKPEVLPPTATCGGQNETTDAFFCNQGTCSSELVSSQTPLSSVPTVCSLFNTTACQTGSCAPRGIDECRLCCVFNGTCQAVSSICRGPGELPGGCVIGAGVRQSVQPAGSACSNTDGYCSAQAVCVIVNNIVPSAIGVTSAQQWFEYTWYFLVAGLCVLVSFSAIYLITTRFCPSERRLRRKAIEATVRTNKKRMKDFAREQQRETQSTNNVGTAVGLEPSSSRGEAAGDGGLTKTSAGQHGSPPVRAENYKNESADISEAGTPCDRVAVGAYSPTVQTTRGQNINLAGDQVSAEHQAVDITNAVVGRGRV